MKNRYIISLITILLLTITSKIFSQEVLKSIDEEYYSFLALQGIGEYPTLNYRTLSDSVWILSDDSKLNEINVWKENNLGFTKQLYKPTNIRNSKYSNGIKQNIIYKIYGPEWFNSFNTIAPYGQNDGALWQGKGYNTSFSTGIRFEGYGFELTFKPQIHFSQNLDFQIMPSNTDSPFGYFWEYSHNVGVDLPQRFGDDSFWTYDWGDSELRYAWKTFTIGFGTQTIWLGPAQLNSMIHSNNAPTYPKIDIGLRKQKIIIPKLCWNLGFIESRMWIGYLSESNYFDNDTSNNHNVINGFTFSYAPSFIPGLVFGFNKVCLSKVNQFSVEFCNPFYDSNNKEDQKCSISLEWLFPIINFNIYGEIGIDDYFWDEISNPFHTMIYTIGFRQIISLGKNRKLKNYKCEILFEWNNFEMSQDFQLQWNYMGYYSHSLITQGYTNKGQIIGAGSGEFGNSQYLAFRFFYPKGQTTFFVHRNTPTSNYNFNKAVNEVATNVNQKYWSNYKTILTFGLNVTYYVTSSLSFTSEIDYSYIHCIFNDNTPKANLNNFRICIQGKYNF